MNETVEEVGRISPGVYERWGHYLPSEDAVEVAVGKLDTCRVLGYVREDRAGTIMVLYQHLDGPHRGERCVCSLNMAVLKFRPLPADRG